jgi:hypothetical protein
MTDQWETLYAWLSTLEGLATQPPKLTEPEEAEPPLASQCREDIRAGVRELNELFVRRFGTYLYKLENIYREETE